MIPPSMELWQVDEDHIAFNGVLWPFEKTIVEFDRRGRSEVYSYFKTQDLPYDMYVQTAMIILKHHLRSAIVVYSDVDDEA